MNYQLIKDNNALHRVCEQAASVSQIALDTEFVRTRTYYPQPGLIQLYDGATLTLIDPLTISNWQPLKALLANSQVLKLLHASSEDLELFLTAYDCLPQPLIDTQVVAAFTGHPLSSSFASLVQEYLQVELDKSETRTDWLARPLSEKQCRYAAADVFYLLPLATRLLEQCQTMGWLEAARDECQAQCLRRQTILQPEQAYLEIGNAWQLKPRQLACLQLLAAWRLTEARRRDLALNFVVREANLWQVARYLPGSVGALSGLGLSSPEIRYHGRTLLELVERAQAIPEAELPAELFHLADHPHYRQVFKQIKSLLQEIAAHSGVSVELLASRRQINQLLQWYWRPEARSGKPELLSGWRRDLVERVQREVPALATDLFDLTSDI